MKAFYEHIDSIEKHAFVFRNINLTFFDAPFHYHPEFELTYIIEGEGIRYVGMKMEEFRAGELVLLGSNLPHCWLNRPQPDGSNVAANVIQFSPKIFESSFFQLLEFEDLKQLFLLAQEGLVFDGHILEPRLQALFEQPPAKRILSLLDLLLALVELPQRRILGFTPTQVSDQKRFQAIFAYIIVHFREKIELETVAQIAGLSPSSFCRYFKQTTGKTLFEVILGYRLEAVAQLLVHSSDRINEIAYTSGFENIPYFNRAFKKWKGLSPREFRTRYQR